MATISLEKKSVKNKPDFAVKLKYSGYAYKFYLRVIQYSQLNLPQRPYLRGSKVLKNSSRNQKLLKTAYLFALACNCVICIYFHVVQKLNQNNQD